MEDRTGLGNTGETYIVGQDFLFRSDSRFTEKNDVLDLKAETEQVKLALSGKSGVGTMLGYRNQAVYCAYDIIDFSKLEGIKADFKWAILAETDESEEAQPISDLARNIVITLVAVVLLVLIIGIFLSRSISRPLALLALTTAKVANDRDLTITLPERKAKDEIKSLIDSFGSMLDTLRSQTLEVSAGATELSASINEISATSTQFSASATETSSSVTEISSTVDELRQVSQNNHQKAVEVAEKSEKVSTIATEGLGATEKVIEGMNKISEEMNFIAQGTIKLGEQTQSISEIISSVNNIADQTNLLSVNASIEAAKAGESGKGFAVVAKEVKALAEQSREATKQITGILTDIQKASGAAVMAAERGSKAVKEGLQLTEVAGKTINALNVNIADAAEAAVQISASSKQEITGMEQLTSAMATIKESIVQNSAGAKQLEESANSLASLGQRLQDMANTFKVKHAGVMDKKEPVKGA